MCGSKRTGGSAVQHEPVVPKAEMAFIEYNGGLQVHSSLLNIVLHD
jgi:hypothetical protein